MPHPAYASGYQRRLANLQRSPPVPCAHCRKRPATTLDHDPPVAMHRHVESTGCCRLIPSCEQCNRASGVLVRNGHWRPGAVAEELPPERDGLAASDRRWRVPWLADLRAVPSDAVWPRLMTVPHPRATGSLGPQFCAWAHERSGQPLRWWQRLVATRLLEVDARDRLVWETAVVTTARQVGKSWLLRELCLWRLHQSERYGEPQDVLHTGKDLAVCKEVQRPARIWAKARRHDYRVREVNGQEEIELLADGSRWMLRAKEAVYGYSVSLGVVDEAWRVKSSSVDEGLAPTMAEREQPQLVLVSTAHRRASALMLERRRVALDALEVADGDLLVEWSAAAGAELDDRAAWRRASPHWGPRRERTITKAHQKMLAGELEDPDEPDPVESFKAQWLNQWPRRRVEPGGPVAALLEEGVWESLTATGVQATGPVWVAIEDDHGVGAAVACAQRLTDGRLELDGWCCGDWDSAVAGARALAGARTVRRLFVGASLLDRIPGELRRICEPRAGTATRTGLALLRDLVRSEQVVHDEVTGELDRALAQAMVRETETGLLLVARGPTHLVRAAVWALAAAHRPASEPAIR